ncbi:MAG TPA: alpha-ribazole phosphatase [Anaerolineales bacterium]|nr:alpha-ribazole phosphatase [Anaerolineales bacterium]HMV97370.1 alpha-ribazole phosphatase [Anaerolineales bacterium]HMZ43856.1 alpha-ribazole phosphatase [Anaerolineales bacterium]HNA55203.1 alpha-ribazole phosphatase [Anaerolineales bacterium]HNB87497.1 alpha-ribazole phosphatase [Anaerolineales bacterium]
MKLYLTRHGQTDWNTAGRYQGQSDTPLNETGLRQAEQIAKRLSKETIHAIYSSDLSRAANTAQSIADFHALEIKKDSRWRELSFGDWEGMTYQEMSASSPELFEAWMKDPLTISTPNGETLAQLAERVKAAFNEIKREHKDQTVLVVAHSGSLQSLLSVTLGVDLNRYWQFRISQASLSEMNVYEDSVVLNLLNDISHFQEK